MTDDDRQLLAYIAIKQAQIDAHLSTLTPLILHLAALRDGEKKDGIGASSQRSFAALATQHLRAEIQFLCEQHPQLQKTFAQLGSLSAKDVADSLKKFTDEKGTA